MNTTVSPDNVFAYADGRIAQAADALWPDGPVVVGPHIPSVTGYVRRVEAAGRPLFAKVSLLGVSLASVLRGTHGDWAEVRAKQAAYLSSPGTLLEREAAQYGALVGAGLGTATVAGLAGGVLFTEPVSGVTLGEVLAKGPHRTFDVLAGVAEELGALQKPAVAALVEGAAIRERSVHGTFARKFNGISGDTYVSLTGPSAPVLGAVVARLRKMRLSGTYGIGIVYGDLKPEHVVFPDGPERRPTFIDPGLALGHPASDVAKLVSRMVLGLIVQPPAGPGATAVLQGIGQFTDLATCRLTPAERAAWLRQLVVLWLMDTVNIFTTYLTAPTGLPLPESARTLIAQAPAVCTLLDRVSALLAAVSMDGRTVWRLALDHAATAAGR
ncbi:hypothetical protein [Streptomyces goshikiensis]|uniref:hypothetical protein n=1 Tax=Streptomyces goshikiensis TaxID=1942 RepID=UPI0033BE63C7